MPRVSVVLPVHNAERHLRIALDGILRQSLGDFEVIAIDDASTDASSEILATVRDPRVRVERNAINLGAYATCNVAIRLARAPLVAIHDADDWSAPTRLAHQVAWLEGHPETALVGSNATLMDGSGRVVGRNRCPATDAGIRWALFLKNPVTHSSVCARRAVMLDAGLYDEGFRIAGDFDLWHRLAALGHRFANLRSDLVAYRVHAGSGSKRHSTSLREETSRIVAAAVLRQLPGASQAAIVCFTSAYFFAEVASANDLSEAHLMLQRLRHRFLSQERVGRQDRRFINWYSRWRTLLAGTSHLAPWARPGVTRCLEWALGIAVSRRDSIP